MQVVTGKKILKKLEDITNLIRDDLRMSFYTQDRLRNRIAILEGMLHDYESDKGDTRHIRYMGETYVITGWMVEDGEDRLKTINIRGNKIMEDLDEQEKNYFI